MNLIKSARNYLKRNSVKRNVFYLLLVRGGNILLQLLLIPISINYVNQENFGFWLTISTAVTWMNLLDFGLANGLRNKLSIAIVNSDFNLGRNYISTTYFFLFILAVVGITFSGLFIRYVKWDIFFTVPSNLDSAKLYLILLIVIGSFFINFLLRPIYAVSYALHKPFVEPLISLLGGILNFLIITFLTYYFKAGDIINLVVIFCFSPIVVNVLITIYLFNYSKLKELSPRFKYVKLKLIGPLFSLGSKFLIIQIAATLQLTTSNFIISKYFGNTNVTEYNIVQKYFSSVLIFQSMVLTPYWNLFTDAYTRKDKEWIKASMNKLLRLNFILCLVIILMTLCAPAVFRLWIGTGFYASIELIYLFAIYTILFTYTNVYITFINGTGKVKVQMISALAICVFYIPSVIILIKYSAFGALSILIVAIIWGLAQLPLRIRQFNILTNFSDTKSIWVK